MSVFKAGAPGLDGEAYRQLRQVLRYARSIQTGLPFPKTRRVVFLSSLPRWTLLELAA